MLNFYFQVVELYLYYNIDMKILNELLPIENVCLGLGFFDGVHIGHKALISNLVHKSKDLNTKSCIITFKKSPAELFNQVVNYLTLKEEKEALFSELGVDYAVELDFNKQLMDMTPEEYLTNILYKYFKPPYIISGFNHTFGKDKKGTPQFLRDNQQKFGYIYQELKPVMYQDKIVSSSLIKQQLSKGLIKEANNMLGYNFYIEGKVIEGAKLGRTIGFPTANIIYPEDKVQIPYGVYSADIIADGEKYKGMMNYGIKPTISESVNEPIAEVHIIDFNKNIYNNLIRIHIKNKIRDEKKFNSLEDLKQQINEDIKLC